MEWSRVERLEMVEMVEHFVCCVDGNKIGGR